MKFENIEQFNDSVTAATERPLVVEFTADWCPSCKALAPFINAVEVKSLNDGQFEFGVADVDVLQGIVDTENVPFIPTIKVYYQGASHVFGGPMKPSRLSSFVTGLTNASDVG